MGSRREGREMALQTLYLSDSCSLSAETALKTTLSESISPTVRKFCSHLVIGVEGNREQIDTILSRYTQNWDLNRMAVVDRNILRLSTFEILSDLDTPVS